MAQTLCYDVCVRFFAVALVSVLVFVVVSVSACAPCRRIETTPLALDCDQAGQFSGELHFDSADSFRSFLTDRCLPDADASEVEDFVGAVDFSTDAVFVARGFRAGTGRCIVSRATESVDVCDSGLQLVFDDEESADASCGGQWTVAFSLSRDDLRAALAD